MESWGPCYALPAAAGFHVGTRMGEAVRLAHRGSPDFSLTIFSSRSRAARSGDAVPGMQ